MTFDGPVGIGTLYIALYRESDGFFRTTGTTFADSADLSVAEFLAGLITATEINFDETGTGSAPYGTGRYRWTCPNLPIGEMYVYHRFDTLVNLTPNNLNNRWAPEVHFIADGSGGQLVPGNYISDATAAKIADILLRRLFSSVEASSNGDALDKDSLYGAMRQIQRSAVSGGVLTIKKTDGTTLGTRAVTAEASADPITSVGG